jgi:hypothetical protein
MAHKIPYDELDFIHYFRLKGCVNLENLKKTLQEEIDCLLHLLSFSSRQLSELRIAD